MTSWSMISGFLILSAALFAQWPSHPTAGAPRKADGKIDMTAPAPKAPDGHPDLSGVWDRGMPPRAATAPSEPPPQGAPPPAAGGIGGPPAPGPRPFQNLPRCS